ncbi:MAG: hypothetical protein GVY29_01600 [Spirochaetes bacterium]|jgi:hypothetical protein|nr:hypothetical protein [Spirochaetota bacterium]
MSKSNRGRNLKDERKNGARGTCPVTGKTGVKLVYEHEIDGKKVMISKTAKATLENAKRREAKKQAQKEQKQEEKTQEEAAPAAAE